MEPEASSVLYEESLYFEKEPEDRNAGIRIINLTKKFDKKVVVDKLTLNFYEGQVTALLGYTKTRYDQ